jgi:hypothetical protein
MDNEIQEFQLWLGRVGTLAKDGNQEARHILWRAFNSLAWPLAKLAQSGVSSIDWDLLEGVLQHCKNMLDRALSLVNDRALAASHALACELCESIEKARGHESGFVAKMERTVPDRPMLRRLGPRKRSAQLVKMILEKIDLSRRLLTRQRKGIESRDTLSRDSETTVRISEAKDFKVDLKEVLKLPKKLDADSYLEWWKVGKKILKRYWEVSPEEYKKDLAAVARQAEASGKTPRTYMIALVQKSFETLANKAK